MAARNPSTINTSVKLTHTFIILHDNGSNSEKLLAALNEITSKGHLQHVRFVLPNAKYPVTGPDGETVGYTWFPLGDSDPQARGASVDEVWPGVGRVAAVIDQIVMAEAEDVGMENVFLGGIGMGAVVGLATLLRLWTTTPLGGFLGVGGWMPFIDDLSAVGNFGRTRLGVTIEGINCDGREPADYTARIAHFLRYLVKETRPQDSSQTSINTPVLLVNAYDDGYQPCARSSEAAAFLTSLGYHGTTLILPSDDDEAMQFMLQDLVRIFLEEPSQALELTQGVMDVIHMMIGAGEYKSVSVKE
ncbi:hypothetical protein BGZ61DRAFT_511876 [Ilyonectria robusta]|uniref:uncharacterized protein n=1 Tax=Ilyonectria robusta TaxID=1079257 RepID=UPI001E8E63B8|nr:uncharacterized protein BGZ61DRAFT_511876 [Ilyonectria robusta]KAH8737239.1 hypothetical protein BGZ61DRAFT_511876 [Ilyonectria robusta]